MSPAVSTAATPGAAAAASVWTERMRPRAMSLRAKRDVQHARHDDIIDVSATPGEQARVFLPVDPAADEPGRGRHERHWPATAFTASTMP